MTYDRNRAAELLAQLDFLGAKEHANQLRAADAEVKRLSSGSVVEIAASNPGIAEYCAHWEQRAEKAEAEIARLKQQAASAEPVAWMDDFGNAFPLGACKGAGSWRDADKRNWRSLYLHPTPAAAPDELARKAKLFDTLNAALMSRSGIRLETEKDCYACARDWADKHDEAESWKQAHASVRADLYRMTRLKVEGVRLSGAVPEAREYDIRNSSEANANVTGWNACRAAMLKLQTENTK